MIQKINTFFGSKRDLTNCIAITESSADGDYSSNFSTPSFCRSVASGSRTPDTDEDVDNQENCDHNDEDSPKSAEAILISPIIKSPIKDFEDTTWKLDESFDVKDLVIANLSPFRTKKLKAVSVSLFENADIDSDRKSTFQKQGDGNSDANVIININELKAAFISTADDIDLQEVYTEAKNIKVGEEVVVEESKSNKFLFRFDEFFIAISGYVFLLAIVFTALFVYRTQSSAWTTTAGEGGLRVGGFCSSCVMEKLQSSLFYPTTTTSSPSSFDFSTANSKRFEPPDNQNRSRKKTLRHAASSSTKLSTTSKPIPEQASLSTIKILWMHIFFVLKDSPSTSILDNTIGGTYSTTKSGGISTTQIHEDLKQFQKDIGSTHSRNSVIASGGGSAQENLTSSALLHITIPLSSDLQKPSAGSNPVIKAVKEKSLKKYDKHLNKKRSNHRKKMESTTALSVTTASRDAGGNIAGGLQRVLNGIKGTVHRSVLGVKNFFQKNIKYTTFLLAMGVYLVFLL